MPIWLQPFPQKERPKPQLLTLEERREFIQRLSFRQCRALEEIVAAEMRRRGFRRIVHGTKLYNAIDDVVTAQVVLSGLDLDEVATQIEEARWEREAEASHYTPTRSHRWREFAMPKTSKSTVKTIAAFTPTRLRPAAPPREFRGSMFRDDKPARSVTQGDKTNNSSQGSTPQLKIRSNWELNAFAKGLKARDLQTANRLIRAQLALIGLPSSTRVGGTSWREARSMVLSGLIQFEVDLNEVRAAMEGDGAKFGPDDLAEGVYFPDEDYFPDEEPNEVEATNAEE